MRKVCINSNNNNLIIKTDKQKENQRNKVFDYLLFIDELEEFDWVSTKFLVSIL